MEGLEGGAIQIGAFSALAIVGSNFTDNKAVANGGAIKIDPHGTVLSRNSQFTRNMAGDFGGALFFGWKSKAFDIASTIRSDDIQDNIILGLSRLTFVRNTASTGGAIFWQDSELPSQGGRCDMCIFADNSAVFGGPDRGTDIKTIWPTFSDETSDLVKFHSSICDAKVEIKFQGSFKPKPDPNPNNS